MKKVILLMIICLVFSSCMQNGSKSQENLGRESNEESYVIQSSFIDENSSISALESIPSIESSSVEAPPDSIPYANVPQLQGSKDGNKATEQEQNFTIIAPESSNIPTETDHDDIGYLVNVEKKIIRLINEQRKSLGLNSLEYDEKLKNASRIRSKELYNNGYIMHKRPDGRKWDTVLQYDIPITFKSAGENLASVEHNMTNYDPSFDANYWFTTWKNSPGHYENMIRTRFTHVGVGIYYIKKNNMKYAYATTLFAEL